MEVRAPIPAIDVVSIVLGALYLRGAPREASLARKRWPLVDSSLRRAGCSLGGAAAALLEDGLWPEAIALEQPCLLAWAESLYQRDAFLTPCSDLYPRRWIDKFDAGAPPAVWRRGEIPSCPFLGIVGSRQVIRPVLEFARGVGAEAVRLGYSVVSGGAQGCDSAGAAGAMGHALEILPYGIHLHNRPYVALSVAAPDEPFSASNAMERNALIYAASEQTVVVHTRFREGGTWTGATDALRRRLCPMLIREDPSSQGHRALLALGGRVLRDPHSLEEALQSQNVQGSLAFA